MVQLLVSGWKKQTIFDKKWLFFADFVEKWQILGHKNAVNCVWAIGVSTQHAFFASSTLKMGGGLCNCLSEAKILNFDQETAIFGSFSMKNSKFWCIQML